MIGAAAWRAWWYCRQGLTDLVDGALDRFGMALSWLLVLVIDLRWQDGFKIGDGVTMAGAGDHLAHITEAAIGFGVIATG